MRPTREGPYRQPASSRDVSSDRPPALARPLALAVASLTVVVVAAPVAALATQPFSFFTTLVAGLLAAWTAAGVIRIAVSST
jgi:hypothetical protein